MALGLREEDYVLNREEDDGQCISHPHSGLQQHLRLCSGCWLVDLRAGGLIKDHHAPSSAWNSRTGS